MSTLSLLSRGNAQVVKNTQKRIEIHYEPEDYFNWRSHHDFQLRRSLNGKYTSYNYWEIPTHKTYSTKKGPLVLYSEDLAMRAWNLTQDRRGHRSHRYKRKKFKIELSTLLDLSGAILSYGRKQNFHTDSHWQPYLHFLNEEDIQYDRQIRPGYSPKRYLTRLLQTWDPNYLYKLQQAGSLRDSVQLQQLTGYSGEYSGRHPDLSSTPLKYQRLPVFTYLPHWTNTNPVTSPGRCTPVEEETGNEEELGADTETLEVFGKTSAVPLSSTGTFRKSSPERIKSHVTQSSWKTKEHYNSHLGETKHSQINGDDTIINRSDYYEKPPVPLEVSFGKDNASLTHKKPHTTFYGGPFTGRRKYTYGKQDLMRLYNENIDHLPEGPFLPPISQSVGPELEVMRDITKEPLKLPPITDESIRIPQRKRRRKAADPPKELLIIPLLVRFENQKVTQEEKTNTDGNTKAVPMNNDEEKMNNNLQSQKVYKEEPVDPKLVKEIPTAVAESRIKTLQMDIDWNLDPNRDGDPLPLPDAPPLSLLPPINGKKGPGSQSSMANLKVPNGSNNNTSSSKGQSLPTGIIRGSIPEELKECCKGGSVGSLIMSPNGEIVCLSLMGSARDTDIAIRFDFIAEEDEDDCPPVESVAQEEQWSGSQQDSEKAMDGSDSSSVQNPTNLVGRMASPQHYKEPPQHKAKKGQRKITDIQEDTDDVFDQQSVAEEIHENPSEEREARKVNKKEVESDVERETNTGTSKEFRKLEARSTDTSATMNSQESLNISDAYSLQDIDAVTGESDLQNDGEIMQSPRLEQHPSIPVRYAAHMKETYENIELLMKHIQYTKFNWNICGDLKIRYVINDNRFEDLLVGPEEMAWKVFKDVVENGLGNYKAPKYIQLVDKPNTAYKTMKCNITSARLTLEQEKLTNGKPSSGKDTLKKQEENIPKAEAQAPPIVPDEYNMKQEPNIKGKGKQATKIQKDHNISKANSPKEGRKIHEINKDVGKETNEQKEKMSGLNPQAEVTQQESPPGKQQTTEEEEMVLLEEITNNAG
ncbi:PREDICTED: uncharacterized protein KIAA2012-like [Nanorana parkeri]|uniref:uncharacterized protein KIAA2012-like n=1 Tax=Nanorana parkeri TaxID=125878 RepID=UPI000853F10F|nr:PREDICTED: uncharacterized protein KIAA2012-like [Nanorana parkeri]